MHPRVFPVIRTTVFYDGWCSLCRRSVGTLKRLDLLGLLVPVSFRDPGILEQFGLDPARVAARLHARAAGAPVPVEGIDAVILIATRLPPLWPVLPVFWLARRLGFGQRLYDWLAVRRTIFPAGHGGGQSGQNTAGR